MNEILDLLKNVEQDLYSTVSLHKEETLFREGDLCEEIGIITQGEIAIISYLEDGSEIIYNRLGRGGIFGNNLVFSTEPYYKGNIIAQTDTSITLIKKQDLLHLLETNKEFMLEYMKILSDQGKQLNTRIRLLSMSSAEEKLFYYMHEHKRRITVSSISDLARDLFLTRETLSRLLSRLSEEKRILRDGKDIRLL